MLNHSKVIFDRELIEKCQTNAPRYTSYPTADRFNFNYTSRDQMHQIKRTFNHGNSAPISLYIHIPFCNTLCLFCGCNKIITNNRNAITEYLVYLEREVQLYMELVNKRLDVIQLHFGGGSPSWLTLDEVGQVMQMLKGYFNLDAAHEIAMEIDPRHTNADFIAGLKANGFNRISIGMQDLDSKVQKAVNRIQSYVSVEIVLNAARDSGFKSTNIDLIYGLPLQKVASFAHTIDEVIKLRPDRIALFNYAHIPQLMMPQTRIKEEDLPSATEKLDILQMSVEKLTQAGYCFIGMDHFALADDELAIALKNGSLQRNFQGYSTFADSNMLAFGLSAIGLLGSSYYQNVKDIGTYYARLDNHELPILRGVSLNEDDRIRRFVIQEIMCQFELNFTEVGQKFSLEFKQYFKYELVLLENLVNLNLINYTDNGFKVTERGRFLIRNVAVVFDKYFQQQKNSQAKYSKVI